MAEKRTGYSPLLVNGSVPGRPVAAVRPESPPLLGILQCWLQPSLDSLPGDSSRDFALPLDSTLTNTLLQLKVTGVPNMSSSHVEKLKGMSLLVRAESDIHR